MTKISNYLQLLDLELKIRNYSPKIRRSYLRCFEDYITTQINTHITNPTIKRIKSPFDKNENFVTFLMYALLFNTLRLRD